MAMRAPREGVNLTPPFISKLQRHMAEPADADNSDPGSRRNIVNDKGREHSDSTAEQRSGCGQVESFRQRPDPGPLSANVVSESTVTPNDSPSGGCAQMMITGKTLVAGKAALRRPAKPHLLTNL